MLDKKYIFFDLDGTLTDPFLGITSSVQYALKSFGIDEPDLKALSCYIGPPLMDGFQENHAFTPEDADKALWKFREYFETRGIWENEIYPGMKELLQTLKDHGKILVVATSKPEKFARMILEHFEIASYFYYVAGSTMDEKRTKKDEVIRYAMEETGFLDPSQIVMIGDRKHDILGAKKTGLASIGVLYGYGSKEELEQAGADAVAADLHELLKLLL